MAQDEPRGSYAWETLLRSGCKDGCRLSREGGWGERGAGDYTGEPPQEIGCQGAQALNPDEEELTMEEALEETKG